MKSDGLKKGILYVFLANALNLIVNVFTAFILPKFLSVDSYANVKLFTLYVTYLGILHLGYADGMYLRNGGKTILEIDKNEAKKEFDTFKIFQLFMCFALVIVSLAIDNKILLMCALVVLPVSVSNYVRNLYNAIGEFKKYSRYTNINTVMIFLVNVLLLLIIKTDYYLWYVIGYVIVYFLYWAFIEYEMYKILNRPRLLPKFEKKYLKENIGSGIFLMTGNFCNVIFTSIDRVFVQNLIGMTEFAYYSFAASVENFLNIFVTPISTTMYNYFCKRPSKEKIIMIKRYCLILAAVVVALIFPVKFVVENWITKYNESLSVLFFLIAAQYVAMLVKIVHVNLYKSKKQQKKYFRIMLLIIAVSAVLNTIGYFMFKNMIAIAVATLITNILWFIIGEINLQEYKLLIKDYMYFALNLGAFLVCGLCLDTVLGFVCYASSVIIMSFVFEIGACRKLFLAAGRYARKVKRKVLKK